jgi:hypothetical protein
LQDETYGQAVCHVIRPLSALRKCANGRDASPDHRKIERGDAQSREAAPRRLGAVRQDRSEHAGPPDGEHKVNGHGGQQQHRRAPLVGQQHGADSASAVEHIITTRERPCRGRDRSTSRSSQAGGERIIAKRPIRSRNHVTIVASRDRWALLCDGASGG